jgi:AhpD family alkylhydroperoxidase
MADLPLLAPAAMDPAQRELYDTITAGPRAHSPVPLVDEHGHLTGPFNALLYAPKPGEAVQQLGARIRFALSLSDRERELATLLVAGRARCRYELAAHTVLATAAGVEPDVIESLSRGEIPDLPDARERAVLRLCSQLIEDPHEATAGDLGTRTLVELTVLVGYYQLLARILTVAGVD